MKYYVLFALVVSVGFCLPRDKCKSEWDHFKVKFNKNYKTEKNEAHRFNIFSRTINKIEEHNKKYEGGKTHFKMAVTKLADLATEEIKKFLGERCGGKHVVEEQWKDFKKKYHKTYSCKEEEQYRFEIFSLSLAEVRKHNTLYQKGAVSYKKVINVFSDLTTEERCQNNKIWPLPKGDYRKEFEDFKKKYHKTYSCKEEEQYRFEIFSLTLVEVRKHNVLYQKGAVSYKKVVNILSDLTVEERSQYNKTWPLPKGDYRKEFEDFKKKYHRTYSCKEEEQYRFEIFAVTLAEVRKHNVLYGKRVVSYKKVINIFSDLTVEERSQYNKTWSLPKGDYRKDFENFKKKYHKTYSCKEEEQYRFEIFSLTVVEVRKHNVLYEKHAVSYKKVINIFSDLTVEERCQNNKVWPLPKGDYRKEFEDFKKKYHKTYSCKEEEQYRFEIFSLTLVEVRKHNALYQKGAVSYKKVITILSDLAVEERSQYNKTWSLPKGDYRKEFEDFKKKYHKTYSCKEEEQYRFEIFSLTLVEVKKHNVLYEKRAVSYKLVINILSDLTVEERSQYNKTWPLPKGDYRKEFEDFKKKYHKTYSCKEEEQYRFEIFSLTVVEVRKHNVLYQKGAVSYKKVINIISDLTLEERLQYNKNWPLPKGDYRKEFEDFKKKYHKTYSCKEEEQYRFEIFSLTLVEVRKQNVLYQKGLVSYKIVINILSDLTVEERSQYNKTWSLPKGDYRKEFEDFKKKYHKTYSCKEEEQYRFEIFSLTLVEVRKQNVLYQKGLVSYKIVINILSDLTVEERSQYNKTWPLPKEDYRKEFEDFKKKYHKTYSCKEEEQYRFEIFSLTLVEVRKHNVLYQKGAVSYKLVINILSDLTVEERSQYNKTWPLPKGDYRKEFEDFKKKYHKTYSCKAEEQYRFEIFSLTLVEVRKHNALYEKHVVTYKKVITVLSDLTIEERSQYNKTWPLPKGDYRKEFEDFKKKYHKTYSCKEEEQYRFEIFSLTLVEVRKHNALYEKHVVTYKKVITVLSDLTIEERSQYNKNWPLPKGDYRKEFEDFKKKYHKTYSCKEEEQYRFEIYSLTLIEVRKHNVLYEKGVVSYKRIINIFADLTVEERRQYKTWPLPKEDYRKEFEDFKKKYHKTYSCKEEEQYRFEIFSLTLVEVRKHNVLYQKGVVSYKLVITIFSDLTVEECRPDNKIWPLPKGDYRKEFKDFKKKYHKTYSCKEEEQYRFEIFSLTVVEVRKHNLLYEKGIVSYKKVITIFADLTLEERRQCTKPWPLPKGDYRKEFEDFKKKYHKTYSCKEEEQYRFEIFSLTLVEVRKHNVLCEKGEVSGKKEINVSSDMTEEEHRKH